MTTKWRISRRDRLLSDLSRELVNFCDVKMGGLEVLFRDVHGKTVLTSDVATALGYLADDVYYNEEADWSDAYTLEVRTM